MGKPDWRGHEKARAHRCNPGPAGHDPEGGGRGSGKYTGDHQGGIGEGWGGHDLRIWEMVGANQESPPREEPEDRRDLDDQREEGRDF